MARFLQATTERLTEHLIVLEERWLLTLERVAFKDEEGGGRYGRGAGWIPWQVRRTGEVFALPRHGARERRHGFGHWQTPDRWRITHCQLDDRTTHDAGVFGDLGRRLPAFLAILRDHAIAAIRIGTAPAGVVPAVDGIARSERAALERIRELDFTNRIELHALARSVLAGVAVEGDGDWRSAFGTAGLAQEDR